MIEAIGLSKRYGDTLAVDDLTFTVRPGVVTGFLGPNGAGKSTTMRMILGLHKPLSGSVRINGASPYDHPAPLREFGALLEANAAHPGRTARNHLRALAATNGIPDRRVDEVIELVGLTGVARRRVGGFSLGMGQRLGIAAALLGDPATIVLDEPVNGLDPEGILWIRRLLRQLASEGRTVFVSSHLLAEMAETAEQVILIGRGRLIADLPIERLTSSAAAGRVRVRSPEASRLWDLLSAHGATITTGAEEGAFEVDGLTTEQVGDAAAQAGIPLHELVRTEGSLEQAFLNLTGDSVDYRASARAGSPA